MRRNYSLYPKNKISTSIVLYQLPLKKINNSFSTEKINCNNTYRRESYPKADKIKKIIEEINLTNPNPSNINNESNNLNACQKQLLEERIKNKNYSENIIILTKHIEELESKLKKNNPNVQNINMNEELMKLKQENKELKQFKEKVYSFSMKYDELNKDIINSLKSIEKIIEIYNLNDFNKNYENEKNNFNTISNNFQLILDNLNNYITVKQDEYNMLLMEKDNELKELKCQYNNSNIDYFANGLRTFRNNNNNKIYEKMNLKKNFKLRNQNRFNGFCRIYKTNDFNFENKRKKLVFKTSFDNF